MGSARIRFNVNFCTLGFSYHENVTEVGDYGDVEKDEEEDNNECYDNGYLVIMMIVKITLIVMTIK